MAENNEPAFPRDHRHQGHNGMTLRDWFAGQALQMLGTNYAGHPWDAEIVAERAYRLSDAMLAQRQKGGEA